MSPAGWGVIELNFELASDLRGNSQSVVVDQESPCRKERTHAQGTDDKSRRKEREKSYLT